MLAIVLAAALLVGLQMQLEEPGSAVCLACKSILHFTL